MLIITKLGNLLWIFMKALNPTDNKDFYVILCTFVKPQKLLICVIFRDNFNYFCYLMESWNNSRIFADEKRNGQSNERTKLLESKATLWWHGKFQQSNENAPSFSSLLFYCRKEQLSGLKIILTTQLAILLSLWVLLSPGIMANTESKGRLKLPWQSSTVSLNIFDVNNFGSHALISSSFWFLHWQRLEASSWLGLLWIQLCWNPIQRIWYTRR